MGKVMGMLPKRWLVRQTVRPYLNSASKAIIAIFKNVFCQLLAQ